MESHRWHCSNLFFELSCAHVWAICTVLYYLIELRGWEWRGRQSLQIPTNYGYGYTGMLVLPTVGL